MDRRTEWQARVDAVWADAALNNAEVIDRIDELAADWPEDDALSLFQTAGARDSAGLEAQAAPRYEKALALGLPESERAQATIQLASTLRNLGRADEAIALLRAELAERPAGEYAGAATAFLALALADTGNAQEATQLAVLALVPHLPRYQRSVAAYARALTAP
ncbi:tetratricopeptide repeat protein [Microterricola viridarii]|uniref:Tetratrico peptide repeat-containing protein n=1 Tax=Microterricola viridarii TaxID=412690 RepID=A0A1H1TP33_9MICO|nr:tetratricopeptide repeat protein [Microterricola viridarii]SDS62010.1 Tetratrico peptide repeat-containing protein [Microterricola viridarii]